MGLDACFGSDHVDPGARIPSRCGSSIGFPLAGRASMKRLLSLTLFVLGLAALFGAVIWLRQREDAVESGPPRGPAMLPVTLEAVVRRDVEPRVLLTGVVRSERRASLGFEVRGRLVEFDVREADTLEAGALIARVDDGDAKVAEARAEATEALAQAELDALLAGSREEELRRLAAEVRVRESAVSLAETEKARADTLIAGNLITQSQWDTRANALISARETLAAAREQLAESEAGTRLEDIDVARARLALRKAELEETRRALEKTSIVAPFPLHVVTTYAALGDAVDPGEPILDAIDLSRREVVLEIPAAHAARSKNSTAVTLHIDERPEFELTTSIDARVIAADPQSGNRRAIARLDVDEDPGGVLEPGQFVRATLHLDPRRDALTVPIDAIRETAQGPVVVRAVQGEGGAWVAEWISIRVMASDSTGVAIESVGEAALAEGDSVVVSGVDLAFDGGVLFPRVDAGGGAGVEGEDEARGDSASGGPR